VGKGKKATCLDYTKDAEIFDKTSSKISNLVYKSDSVDIFVVNT
jgi:hypothetical protein